MDKVLHALASGVRRRILYTENLKALIETGKPTAGGHIALFMMGLFAPFTPSRCKSEHWPL